MVRQTELLLQLLAISLQVASGAKQCDTGAALSTDTERKCYYIQSDTGEVTFAEAYVHCKKLGGRLWTFDTEAQFNVVKDKIGSQYYWTNFVELHRKKTSDLKSDREFKAIDGPELLPTNYFLPSEPNYLHQDCTRNQGGLVDINCHTTNRVVCEKPVTGQVKLPQPATCPAGYTDPGNITGKCYKLLSKTANYCEAQAECIANSGRLPRVADMMDLIYIAFYIGTNEKVFLDYTLNNGVFQTSNLETPDLSMWWQWNDVKKATWPKDGDCTHIQAGREYRIGNLNCADYLTKVLCEYDAATPTVATMCTTTTTSTTTTSTTSTTTTTTTITTSTAPTTTPVTTTTPTTTVTTTKPPTVTTTKRTTPTTTVTTPKPTTTVTTAKPSSTAAPTFTTAATIPMATAPIATTAAPVPMIATPSAATAASSTPSVAPAPPTSASVQTPAQPAATTPGGFPTVRKRNAGIEPMGEPAKTVATALCDIGCIWFITIITALLVIKVLTKFTGNGATKEKYNFPKNCPCLSAILFCLEVENGPPLIRCMSNFGMWVSPVTGIWFAILAVSAIGFTDAASGLCDGMYPLTDTVQYKFCLASNFFNIPIGILSIGNWYLIATMLYYQAMALHAFAFATTITLPVVIVLRDAACSAKVRATLNALFRKMMPCCVSGDVFTYGVEGVGDDATKARRDSGDDLRAQ